MRTRPHRERKTTPLVAPLLPPPPLGIDQALDRFIKLYPGRLGRQTIQRIRAVAESAKTLRVETSDGEYRTLRMGPCVLAACLCDVGGLTSDQLPSIMGGNAMTCAESARLGRKWLVAYDESTLASRQRRIERRRSVGHTEPGA